MHHTRLSWPAAEVNAAPGTKAVIASKLKVLIRLTTFQVCMNLKYTYPEMPIKNLKFDFVQIRS